MEDDQTSPSTRVILLHGQTIILQGDPGDNSINEINADLLQQALQEVSSSAEEPVEEPSDGYSAPIPESDANDNLVAIFQGDQGETHTIQLTVQQAEELGLHFSVDGDDKSIQPDISDHTVDNNLYITDDPNSQLVFSGDSKHNQDVDIYENDLGTTTSCVDLVQNNRTLDDKNGVLETTDEMGVLSSSVGTLIGEQNEPITLIPQYAGGQMTYTVKIQDEENEGSLLQSRQFANVDSDIKVGSPIAPHQTNVGVTLNNIGSFTRGPLSVSCSASTSASSLSSIQSVPLTVSSLQQSGTLPPISSVEHTVPSLSSSVPQRGTLPITSLSVPNSSLQQTLSLNNYQCSRLSGGAANSALDKQPKVSYVILPGINTCTNSSVTTKLSNTPLGRLSSSFVSNSRNQSLINSNNTTSALKNVTTLSTGLSSTNSTQITVSGTNSGFTGISLVNSNNNATSTSSILAPVATSTSTAGGMIRVVAGAPSNRTLQPVLNNSANKFTNVTNVLPSASNRLIGSTPGTVTTVPKIVSINPTSVNKVPTTATPEVTNMVSAALTRMPVPNFNSTKPLGSSENPIQLVQHGQTFHSVQSLTQEQLRQIATVLQQQHLESAPRTKNVVYDAETNTRIIYRVVYPEDLDLRDPRSPDGKGSGLNSGLASGSSRGRGRRGRPPKSNLRGGLGRGIDGSSGRRVGVNSAVDMDFDEDRLILDDTAKGEKKKQLARTRSGRLSRPPRHMVKDYKRLHHLDFADADLDDSDGGYSDYQMSEHEAEEPQDKADKELLPGTCEANELAEVAGPAVAGVLSLWELLLLRVEAVRTEESYVVTLCDELQALLEKVRALQDELLCTTFGVTSGTYLVDDRKLQYMSVNRDSCEEPPEKRPRTETQEDTIETNSTKSDSAEVKGDKKEDRSTRNSEDSSPAQENRCPEVLSALTLIAKPSVHEESECDSPILPSRTSGNDDDDDVDSKVLVGIVQKSEDFLLSSESNDMCPKLSSVNEGVESAGATLDHNEHASEFANSEAHSQELETVDDIVNERLKNLTSGSNLVDFSVAAPMNVVSNCMTTSAIDIPKSAIISSQDLIDRLGQFRTLRLPNDVTSNEVSSFDPELALAAMGEGEQDTVGPSNQHFQMETVPSDSGSSFDPEVALAAMGEGEQPTSLESQHNQFQRIENVPNGPTFTPEDALAAMGEGERNTSHEQFQNTLSQINSMTNNRRQSFDPEIALAAMGEGDPVENDGRTTTENRFQSTLQQIRIVNVTNNNGPFDPEVALAAMGEGTRRANEVQDQFSTAGSASSSSYSTSMELDIGSSRAISSKSSTQCTDNVASVSSFDPDMTLAAMGKGQALAVNESSHIPYQSPMSQRNSSNETNAANFNPEIALAAIRDEATVQGSSSSQTSHADDTLVDSSSFRLQCAPDLGLADASMDVSLDESGPELDFEALSEEFNRNTRHR
ncbi:hypothetical protein C0J52_13922 [Blattella germanica]|nr:hypothetical protein C0J52_13922 [Blattella germanica]